MREPAIRAVGLATSLVYAAAIAWLYTTQPQNVAQVTGGFASIVGVYKVEPQAFADGAEQGHLALDADLGKRRQIAHDVVDGAAILDGDRHAHL